MIDSETTQRLPCGCEKWLGPDGKVYDELLCEKHTQAVLDWIDRQETEALREAERSLGMNDKGDDE